MPDIGATPSGTRTSPAHRRLPRWTSPVPGCSCPPSYVRDVCQGHTEPGCPFKGLFGRDLSDAHRTAWEHAQAFGAVAS